MMKKCALLNVFWPVLLIILLFSCGGGGGGGETETVTKLSSPGKYEGYSQPIYTEYVRQSLYVPVRDGTKLAVDVYRPATGGKAIETPLPAVFIFTPYRRAYYDSNGNLVLTSKENIEFTKYGYVLVVADVRGTNASYGVRWATNTQTEAFDARDIVLWIKKQSWSNGKVGMTGCSYVGGTALEAIRAGAPVDCAFVCSDWNAYDAKGIGGLLRGPSTDPDWTADLIAAPVDGDTDKVMLMEAIEQHKYNPKQIPFLQTVPYRNSWSDVTQSMYWEEIAHSNYMDVIKKTGTAIYIYTGWYDFLRRDSVVMFNNWPHAKKLLIGPWPHCGGLYDTSEVNLYTEMLRFFDYWLKGIDNGIMKEPPIYFVTENAPQDKRWQFSNTWPLTNEERINYFLCEGKSGTVSSMNDGLLCETLPSSLSEKDTYTPRYDISINTDWYAGRPRPSVTDIEQKGLTYTTAPLSKDLQVTGHPILHLWVSSTAPDAGFFITLEDVDPDGKSIYVGDGRLRASMRTTQTPPYDNLGLPWHRCYAEDERLLDGKVVKLTIDLLPTSYVFKKGHRIRITITNAMGGWFINFPKYDPAPTITIYRNALTPSYIELPVIR